MQTKPLLKKGLVVGIIVLLGTNIVPIVSSSSSGNTITTDKLNPASLSDSRGFNVSITGTMGENGWYVSNVIITFTADNGSGGVPIYYKLHAEDPWIEIPWSPITINTDGYYELWVKCVDSDGQWYDYGPYPFKIDKTAPEIIVTATAENRLCTKWLFSVTDGTGDQTSGIARVEFYLDDVLVGNISAPGPYECEFEGRGSNLQGVAYDIAGNRGMSPSVIINALSENTQSQKIFITMQKTNLFENLICNLLFHHQIKG